jgi:hypothetical protein
MSARARQERSKGALGRQALVLVRLVRGMGIRAVRQGRGQAVGAGGTTPPVLVSGCPDKHGQGSDKRTNRGPDDSAWGVGTSPPGRLLVTYVRPPDAPDYTSHLEEDRYGS